MLCRILQKRQRIKNVLLAPASEFLLIRRRQIRILPMQEKALIHRPEKVHGNPSAASGIPGPLIQSGALYHPALFTDPAAAYACPAVIGDSPAIALRLYRQEAIVAHQEPRKPDIPQAALNIYLICAAVNTGQPRHRIRNITDLQPSSPKQVSDRAPQLTRRILPSARQEIMIHASAQAALRRPELSVKQTILRFRPPAVDRKIPRIFHTASAFLFCA